MPVKNVKLMSPCRKTINAHHARLIRLLTLAGASRAIQTSSFKLLINADSVPAVQDTQYRVCRVLHALTVGPMPSSSLSQTAHLHVNRVAAHRFALMTFANPVKQVKLRLGMFVASVRAPL